MFWNKEDKRISNIEKAIKFQEEKIDSQNVTIGELVGRVDSTISEFNQYRNDSNDRSRKLNNLVNEKLDGQKESTEALLIRLERVFEDKINTISSGAPLITDLLRKIAVLEGVKDAIEHRRSTEEVLGTINVIDESMLKDQREEKDISVKQKQIKLLRWVLGDVYE